MSSVVHCNLCGVFPSPQCTSFRLSNCGHIFCQGCTDKGRLAVKCNRCNAAAPKCINIDRNLNPNLQTMFKKASAMVAEHMDELNPLMKFQTSQRSLRFKAHDKKRQRIIELESQVTTLLGQVKLLQHERHEQSRARHSSRDSREESRSLSRVGDVSETSHHQTMSSTGSIDTTRYVASSAGSIDTTAYLDPFKTPMNGLKRFTTSTPKVQMPPKKNNNATMNSRVSHSSIPSLSLSMEVDDETTDITPASSRDQSRPDKQPSLPSSKSSSKMTINSDPLLAPKPSLPKTPAPRKNQQSLSMAERLSGSRPKAPQGQQPEVTSSSTPRAPPVNTHKTPYGTPLVAAHLKPPAPITPIRPIHGSQLPSSVGAAFKPPLAPAFKTPAAPPAKKVNAAARTVPAGMKTGMGGGGTAHPISQQPHS